MKDVDLSQVFCEVLAGLAAILLVVGILDISAIASTRECRDWGSKYATFAGLAGLFVGSYFIGLVVDAFGLVFDKLVTERWKSSREKRTKRNKKFYASAPEHVFAYWKEQWTYFSCYRNLFMLIVPGSVIWTWVVHIHYGCRAALIILCLMVFLEVVLWFTIRDLYGLYCRIPGYFCNSTDTELPSKGTGESDLHLNERSLGNGPSSNL